MDLLQSILRSILPPWPLQIQYGVAATAKHLLRRASPIPGLLVMLPVIFIHHLLVPVVTLFKGMASMVQPSSGSEPQPYLGS